MKMIRTNDFNFGTRLRAVLLAGAFFLLATVMGFGQQQINLTVAPTTTTLPDGTLLPMWGYSCGSVVSGSTATCAALNSASVANPLATTWSPVVITVPTGQALTINLTNNLSFATGTGTNTVPTSIVIVGQVGGGLGSARTTAQSPDHSLAQGCPTWFIASPNTPPGQPCTTTAGSPGSGTPPNQANRVQSMAQEVAATGATVLTGEVASGSALTWSALRPGTYLLESGTHPSIQVPMGLVGMLVVTTPPSGATPGTAYPGAAAAGAIGAVPAVQYNAEVPVLFSEIDPVQNKAVATAVATAGFSETKVWSGMTGQCGNPTSPVGVVNTCYPPVVNYTPFYYLINGVAFDKTNPTLSEFPATAGTTGAPPVPVTTGIPTTGTVLVRLVNAGLRMHVPSIVGSQTQGFNGAGAVATVAGFTLIAEDGNVVPGVAAPGKTAPSAPKVQTDVFMAAGKTYDVMVNVPAAGATATPTLPVYARDLALSGNSSERDAGAVAYISVNNNLTASPGAGLPVAPGTGIFSAAKANNDTYDAVSPCASNATSCTPLVISDVSKGVISNDVNVYGVQLLTAPTNGTLTCTSLGTGLCANGTFTYTPNKGSSGTDSFTYCANNGFVAASGATPASCSSAALMATVTLGASTLSGNPTAIAHSYTAHTATFIKIPSPGLLLGNTDPSGLPFKVVTSPAPTVSGGTGTAMVDAQGGFTLSLPSNTAATTVTFSYTVQNSQGRSSAPGTVTVHFPAPSNLAVKVVDAQAYRNCNGDSTCVSKLTLITDYRWIIEEDKTFYIDPNCTTNSSISTPGCPSAVGPAGQSTIPTFGVNFHTSTMDFVAQGCTGPLACEGGQTMLDTRPACTSPGVPAGCSTTAGQHINAVCDLGNGACRPDTAGNGFTPVMPSSVVLNPAKRYYISVLPGDAANPFPAYTGNPGCSTTTGAQGTGAGANPCGHTMSGAPIPAACNILGGPNACTTSSTFTEPVTVLVLPSPLPTGKLTVMVFEDDYPLNGEQDGGGGNATVAPLEPGLGGFNIVLWDTFGGLGDVTGQDGYDMFNQPLSNSLAGTIDPVSGLDACPVSKTPLSGPAGSGPAPASGMTGMIVTCPKYEADGQTLSPLAGQAVIANLMPEKFSVQAYPGADRIARGEEWIQTNTLDGQHPHDSFIRIGEPSYFQEYGPAGYHVSIGFANPTIINARHADVCAGAFGAVGACTGSVTGQVDVQRLSRTPDQRLYASGSRDGFAWTQCWVSLGDPDAEDFMFTKCDANGNFKFTSVPGGNWRLTIGDQWNDQIIDGLSTPANVTPGQTLNLGQIGAQQWQSNVYTRTFIDDNKDGVWEPNEIGIPLIFTMIHYRDGHNANALTTDFNGVASFNETFPLFNWYVVEADSGRYKTTGIHTVYDAGGPADGSSSCGPSNGARACGTSTGYSFLANTFEAVPLPADLSVPGAVYCATADCSAEAPSFAAGTAIPSPGRGQTASTGRIDPPWVGSEGWSGLTSQSNWIEFGKAPYAECNPALPVSSTNFCTTVTTTAPGSTTPTRTLVGENGGIHGIVDYSSTRPFDSASWMVQQPWEPFVPHVTINLYQEGFAADGVTPTLTMVDTTQTSSWDDWAQGFYPNSAAGSGAGAGQKPYMSCPGQGTAATGTPNQDLFYFTLFDQPNYLDWYNNRYNGGAAHALPYNSQYKCYDAMHIWNQLQPAPYDGKYSFPSVLGINPTTGKLLAVRGSTNGVTSSMNGTNCTVCVANPDSTDHYRVGTPMLPPGKYTVEVIMPPGFEVYKEEDKNLLIGDNYIAPVTQQFGGLGTDIFIMPDQASVASLYDQSASGFNPNNYQNSTTALGMSDTLGLPAFPGFQDPSWPCVGEMRVVPDYLSLFPGAQEVAPFAGATRPLCDRKEVTLANQMSVSAKFYIFTSTHIASKFTGVITDDFTSEFDPFAPQFGEKFAPPNLPISTRDYLGNEISRVYSDHWGIYDGLNFSSWEVNPPNITGYSPTMMVQCMNDPGPILDKRSQIPNPAGAGFIANPTFGQMITDPLYNPAYSDFCYEEPYMPGLTTYLDTPVVPTQAFVGAAYNDPDCNYPDATPAIKEVDGDGVGPWLSSTGALQLTITALGDVQVTNSDYSGPSASVPPFNLKTVKRHYGFGPRPATCGNGANCPNVTIGGVNAVVQSWSDATIVATARAVGQIPLCTVQQQAQYGGSQARCGQLIITAANGNASIDTVTVTIGGKPPIHVASSAGLQAAIDHAAPGDLIMVDPTCTTGVGAAATAVSCTAAGATKAVGSHNEMLIMWKPVRLQGVGAATSVINANAQPAGRLLDPWRRHINCLFGLTLQGVPYTAAGGAAPYDPSGAFTCPDNGWMYFNAQPNVPQIDRLPLEATTGWDATLNGNLAEQLQEPTLMGAYEGAAITVLAKGLDFHGANPWSDGTEVGAFPAVTTLLTGVGPNPTALAVGDANPLCTDGTSGANRFPSNFACNPSSIDGLSVVNSSQGGGGIFAHGWAHHLQIANNRVYNNAGTLTGGISVGQGEFPTPYLQGSTTNPAPGSCSNGTGVATNQHLPYCLQLEVNVHHNFITNNSSLGDELFSATLSGGGGVTFCTGNDYYMFNYNWVCGNLSSGEGGGLVHLGEIQQGAIEHNAFLFNQSDNPTIPTNGGGIQVMGTPDTDPTCGAQIDADCPPGVSDGTGRGLKINANLIQGNMAESGSGGGIRLQQINGTEVSTFPSRPGLWNSVSVTNNIIVNNVAGWDGAGISLQDSLNVQIVNNTIASNDSLASSGVLTQSIGTPAASAPAGNCVQAGLTTSCPQSAGLTSTQNSPLLLTSLSGMTLTCPNGQPDSNCHGFSNPVLMNNVIWQNRSFYIGVGNLGQGTLNQQKLVSLFDAFTGAAAPVQSAEGQCTGVGNYWDVGVRGDTGPGNHASTFALNPMYSVMSNSNNTATYSATNSSTAPPLIREYCNGSRVPPECSVADGCGGPSGYGVPPGIVDASAPNPVFSLTPAATVDEGNNWINVSWGPLALNNPVVTSGAGSTGTGNYGSGPSFGNYALSAAIDTIPVAVQHPPTDFFGNLRPESGVDTRFDPGAVEFAAGAGGGGGAPGASLTPSSHNFGTVTRGTPFGPTFIFLLSNTGTATLTNIVSPTITADATNFSIVPLFTTCGTVGLIQQTSLAPGAACSVAVRFNPPLSDAANSVQNGTVSITDSVGTQTATLSGTAR
jgi:hypothetical protein